MALGVNDHGMDRKAHARPHDAAEGESRPARDSVAAVSPRPAAMRLVRSSRRSGCSSPQWSLAHRRAPRTPGPRAAGYPETLAAEGRNREPALRTRRLHGHGASRGAR
jgi:hypothetical protein